MVHGPVRIAAATLGALKRKKPLGEMREGLCVVRCEEDFADNLRFADLAATDFPAS